MPKRKKTTRKSNTKKTGIKKQRKRFPSLDDILLESSYHLFGSLRKPTKTLAVPLSDAIKYFNDISQISVLILRENKDGVQLEHQFTLMKFGQSEVTIYEEDQVKIPYYEAMKTIDMENIRYLNPSKGSEWLFTLKVGDVEPVRESIKKMAGYPSWIFVPIVTEERSAKKITGILIIKGDDLSLEGSKNKTGKRAIQESTMYSANMMSVVSFILANNDITGLPKKQDFKRDLDAAVEAYHKDKTSFCIMMIDIDHFTRVNDKLGHVVADEVLAGFSRIIQNSIREAMRCSGGSPDEVYRWGGEEFTIKLEKTEREDALEVAERIRREVQNAKIMTTVGSVSITCSIGVVSIEDVKDKSSKSLEKLSDYAMYKAKRAGRNRVYWVREEQSGPQGDSHENDLHFEEYSAAE